MAKYPEFDKRETSVPLPPVQRGGPRPHFRPATDGRVPQQSAQFRRMPKRPWNSENNASDRNLMQTAEQPD
jgi:hypothetical protein